MFNHEFTITGSSKAFFRLAKDLKDFGHNLQIFPAIPEPGAMLPYFESLDVPISSNCDPNNFDLAIFNTIATGELIPSIPPQLPIIWFINEGDIAVMMLCDHPPLREALSHIRSHTGSIIFNTESQRKVLQTFIRHLPENKIHVCPFGITIDINNIVLPKILPKTTAIRIVQVGTVEGRKRAEDLIKAVSMFSADVDIECIICGKIFNMEEDAVEIFNSNRKRFKIIENLEDDELLACMASADIFCLASYNETQALAVYEAALLERPLILSALPCYDGVFEHGTNCLMFPARNPEALAAMIATMITCPDYRIKLGKAARQAALPYTNAAFLSKFNAVVQRVTNQSIYPM
ncbi:glycosyltransferase family 4 protein [Granulibacter bethesdensis]|uniref:glycosyltransferase family 4 protein n=1 Tax=Granulibacter bethesdensis TaxID=364410 RepID=UPI0012FE5765|nr:glycosyltransferase family 4 protein [Granulibacter bethesdensis]